MACFLLLRVPAAAAAGPLWPEAVADLKARAEALLSDGPWSVMDKTETPPSGDKHDYFSLSPYHWPNPDTPDGLPYVFRDGQVNPEARGAAFDRDRYGAMVKTAERLALAWRHTGEERFAVRAALLLRVWFLAPETRMNPHLEYAQYIRGAPKEDQKSWGIIRGTRLVRLNRAVEWIAGSGAWSGADTRAWREWLRAYIHWLTRSEKGQAEAKAVNNHGTWYDVQTAALALACGEAARAKRVLEQAPERRIARQIKSDGRQIFEMIRTKSWDYSIMNLEGLFELARLGEQVGLDLWHFRTDDGRCLRAALDFLVPAATGEKEWPGKQVEPFRPEKLYPLLRRAAVKYDCPAYLDAAQQIPGAGDEAAEDWLFWPEVQ